MRNNCEKHNYPCCSQGINNEEIHDMVRTCYLCGRNSTKDKNMSLHHFPKNQLLLLKWKAVCDLKDFDDVTNVFICSNHFDPEDFQPIYNARGRNRLKPNAIPMVAVPNPIDPLDLLSFPIEIPENDKSLISKVILVTPNQNKPNAIPTVAVSDEILMQVENDKVNKIRLHAEVPSPSQEENIDYIEQSSTPKRSRIDVEEIFEYRSTTPQEQIVKKGRKILNIQKNHRLLQKRITCLDNLFEHLIKKQLISLESVEKLMSIVPKFIIDMANKKLRGQHNYSNQIRSFALTLHFFSPKSYAYVRRIWKKFLPMSTMIQRCYSVIDGSPGFTKESLQSLFWQSRKKKVLVNLAIEEFTLTKDLIYDKRSFHGGVDYGTMNFMNHDSDNPTLARSVIILMAVALNDSWKIPIAYFFISTLNGEERATLLKHALWILNEHRCQVHSITCNGDPTNLSMCQTLGCNFQLGSNFKAYFIDETTNRKVYIFLDFSKMLNFVRNTLGDKKILRTIDDNTIEWSYIETLYELKRHKNFRTNNKLTNKHINYNNDRTNVRLSIQTLSESVCRSLQFLHLTDTIMSEEFSNSSATAEFCLNFNNIGEMLNSRNKLSKRKYNASITDNNYSELKVHGRNFQHYIYSLRDDRGKSLLQSNRNTGFLGIIINLENMFSLYDDLKRENDFNYLLMNKLSLEHLKTFYSAVENCFNSPNALQFKTAYKRIVLKRDYYNNYNLLYDGIDIIRVSSASENLKCPIADPETLQQTVFLNHNYLQSLFRLNPYLDNIFLYISGYVSKRLISVIDCTICKNQLIGTNVFLMSELNNWKPFIVPSNDAKIICRISEQIIRENYKPMRTNIHSDKQPRRMSVLFNQIFNSIGVRFDNKTMNEHVLSQELLDNHRSQLCKYIISFYCNIRLFGTRY